MELDAVLERLKFLSKLPFVKTWGVEDIVEAAYRSMKFLHESVIAHTLTIVKLETVASDMQSELDAVNKKMAAYGARLDNVEAEVYGAK